MGIVYDGQHPVLIPQRCGDLQANAARERGTRPPFSPLVGKIFDETEAANIQSATTDPCPSNVRGAHVGS